jgi:hypothetical protein
VALVRTDVSEECITTIIRVTRIEEPGTLEITSNRSTLMMEATYSSKISVLSRATRRNIPEDSIVLIYISVQNSWFGTLTKVKT